MLPGRAGETRKVMLADTAALWSTMRPNGEFALGLRYPPGISFDTPIVGEPYVSATDNGTVVGFRWSDAVIVLDSFGNVVRTIRGPERKDFPSTITSQAIMKDVEYEGMRGDAELTVRKVDRSRGEATAAIAASDNEIYVLVAGTDSALVGRQIDRFDLHTGAYLGTHLLPHRVRQIAALGGGRIATLEKEMDPLVRVWRLPQGTAGRR